ncbi:MAG TPA: glycosyltransferase family 8 protein [Flavipsychrobacter sp.]|nr:glycosyltransferase family 8 protein [Flavipsychrobacter sp.]
MEIALGLDEKYVMPGGVLMLSIVKTHTNTPVNFHILSEALSDKSKMLLRDCIKHAPFASVSFYNITDWEMKSKMPEAFHFTKAIYYKLFVAHLLPPSLSRVLYFDSDMLVVDSLKELWETDLEDYAAAASIDLHHDDIRDFNRLGYHQQYGYFNSGMCLMNLNIWRTEDLPNKILSFVLEHKERCKYYDQDAINYILCGRIKRVSFKYNTQEFYAVEDVTVRKSLHEDLLNSRERPVVIHYIGGIKPWHIECQNPYKNLWKYMQQQTPWANVAATPAFSPLDKYPVLRWAKRVVLYALKNPDTNPTYASPNLPAFFQRLQ